MTPQLNRKIGRYAGLQHRHHVHVSQLRPGPPNLEDSPAVAAGVAKHRWSIEDIVDLLPIETAKKRGPYKKRISN